MKNPPYTPYRRTLAWIGFVTIYLFLPLAVFLSYHYVTATADRSDLFYQQTIDNITN